MKKKTPSALSKFGLPKNIITTFYPRGLSEEARHWWEARSAIEALLLDIEDARENDRIDRKSYVAERSQLSFQFRHASQEYEKALRRPKSTPPRKRS